MYVVPIYCKAPRELDPGAPASERCSRRPPLRISRCCRATPECPDRPLPRPGSTPAGSLAMQPGEGPKIQACEKATASDDWDLWRSRLIGSTAAADGGGPRVPSRRTAATTVQQGATHRRRRGPPSATARSGAAMATAIRRRRKSARDSITGAGDLLRHRQGRARRIYWGGMLWQQHARVQARTGARASTRARAHGRVLVRQQARGRSRRADGRHCGDAAAVRRAGETARRRGVGLGERAEEVRLRGGRAAPTSSQASPTSLPPNLGTGRGPAPQTVAVRPRATSNPQPPKRATRSRGHDGQPSARPPRPHAPGPRP